MYNGACERMVCKWWYLRVCDSCNGACGGWDGVCVIVVRCVWWLCGHWDGVFVVMMVCVQWLGWCMLCGCDDVCGGCDGICGG